MNVFVVLTLVVLGLSLEFLIPALLKCWRHFTYRRVSAPKKGEPQ